MKPLSVLLVEDSPLDAELLEYQLRTGFDLQLHRVETPRGLEAALEADQWQVLISDYSLPGFNGLEALRILQRTGRDLPFILVSGTIGEEAAVQAMKAGAHDYIMKSSLKRLVPAVERELREVETRAARRRSDEALRALQKAVETLPIGVTVCDTTGRIIFTNPAEARLHGYSVEELMGREARTLVANEYARPLTAEQIRELSAWKRERMNLRKDGSSFPAYLISDTVRSPAGEPIGIVTTCEDITERKRAEEQLLHHAFYDSLTGLANRALFLDRLHQAVERMKRRRDYRYAVLFLDLDRFKVVNDSLGHTAGDELLVRVARRLEGCLRPGDTVARLGGDEFAILIDEVKDDKDAVMVAERTEKALRAPFQLGPHEVFTAVSTGIAMGRAATEGPEEILRDADTAMYRAKANGRARHEVFDSGMHAMARQLQQMEADLRRAVHHQEFVVWYQPMMTLATGRVDVAEALIRWRHPQRGLVNPDEFIPLAEETGLIARIGAWVLSEACARSRAWQRDGRDVGVAVNVSSRQFRKPEFVASVKAALARTGLSPTRLELELTESAVMDDVEHSIGILQELKALGIRLSIDDFGTGHSSLSYLKLLPVYVLKIDRSFVRQITEDPRDAAIVTSIIGLAHSLKLTVVAEGVETPQQLAFLQAERCDVVQGYLIGRPCAVLEAGGGRSLRSPGVSQ